MSSWLVRFLEPAPLTQATTALALFWAGLTLGRLAAARLADRFDHTRFTIVSAAATGVVLLGAILVPSLPVSIALFALAGFVDRAGLSDGHGGRPATATRSASRRCRAS